MTPPGRSPSFIGQREAMNGRWQRASATKNAEPEGQSRPGQTPQADVITTQQIATLIRMVPQIVNVHVEPIHSNLSLHQDKQDGFIRQIQNSHTRV